MNGHDTLRSNSPYFIQIYFLLPSTSAHSTPIRFPIWFSTIIHIYTSIKPELRCRTESYSTVPVQVSRGQKPLPFSTPAGPELRNSAGIGIKSVQNPNRRGAFESSPIHTLLRQRQCVCIHDMCTRIYVCITMRWTMIVLNKNNWGDLKQYRERNGGYEGGNESTSSFGGGSAENYKQ